MDLLTTQKGKAEVKKKTKKISIISGIAMSICGFVLIPPIVDKCSRKLYYYTRVNKKVDIDQLEPEIVRK